MEEPPATRKHKCLCCGYFTFKDPPSATYDICPVCFWEDDRHEPGDLGLPGGPNHVSLREARANFRKYGACTPDMVPHVRRPNTDEVPLH